MDRAENLLSGDGAGLLARIGLHRPELRAWAMYDWANSAFQTTVITAVFPRFFSDYAAAGLSPTDATARFALATTIAVTITALIGPILGAIADVRGLKKTLLGVSMSVGIVATLLMATISRGGWMYGVTLFMIANIGIAASFVFYDSLLPHIAAPDEMDRVSTAAYAIGYLGGGVLLVVNLAWILAPTRFGLADSVAAIRLSFVSVAVWWLLFHCHCSFASANQRPGSNQDESRGDNSIRVAFVRCGKPSTSCAAIVRPS
jgi:UMF1 family MFS transporter